MALFNSVLIGKAKGKVGNVVLTSIKGQNIVKSLNDKPANPRSVGQTDNRNQMSNAVLAWQFLAMFFSFAGAISKSTESTYNAFVRVIKSGLDSVLYPTRSSAAIAALELNLFIGNWFSISSLAPVLNVIVAGFNTSGAVWVNTMRYCYVEFDADGTAFKVLEGSVLESAFNAGSLTITGSTDAVSHHAFYIYDSASSKITDIYYQDI